jgi:hypothetical protein
VKGLRIEKIIDSVVKIHTDAKGERVTAVEDRWNGNIPDGAFAKVHSLSLPLSYVSLISIFSLGISSS